MHNNLNLELTQGEIDKPIMKFDLIHKEYSSKFICNRRGEASQITRNYIRNWHNLYVSLHDIRIAKSDEESDGRSMAAGGGHIYMYLNTFSNTYRFVCHFMI